jgi:TRAP-type C4-dicarboxylate transport system permease small subunit
LRLLEILAKACAIAAGVLLVVITLMNCVSLIGRNTTGWTLVGDFELTAMAAAAAIALFMPWCQYSRGHVIVDFFTLRARASTRAALDRLGALMLAVVMALLAWRTTLGGLSAWQSQSGSMMLGFPEWVVFAHIVPPLALTALIALVQALRGFDAPAHNVPGGTDNAGGALK